MFSHKIFTIYVCGIAMGRRFAYHMQNLSYIIGEIYHIDVVRPREWSGAKLKRLLEVVIL